METPSRFYSLTDSELDLIMRLLQQAGPWSLVNPLITNLTEQANAPVEGVTRAD